MLCSSSAEWTEDGRGRSRNRKMVKIKESSPDSVRDSVHTAQMLAWEHLDTAAAAAAAPLPHVSDFTRTEVRLQKVSNQS